MPALFMLIGSIVWNYLRSRRGRSTICSTSRRHMKPAVLCAGWALLTAWFLPHYCRPFHPDGALALKTKS